MNRKGFDKLDVLEQLNYINMKLEQEQITLTKICKGIGIGRATVSDRAKKIGYSFNKDLNRYICDNDNIDITYKENIVKNEVATTTCYNGVKDITLEKIIKKADKIIDMLEWWENRKERKDVDISKLNSFDFKTKNRSFNVNNEILNQFIKYCNLHKEYKQSDLISIALLEFLEKYK